MTANPARAIERLRERLDTSEDISEADAAVLRKMSNRIRILGPAEYSDHRHEFLLMRCVKLAEEVGGLADALDDRGTAEELVAWINTHQTNSAETNKDYRVALRMFGELATDGEGKPDSISWIPGGYPKNYDPAPEPGKMLRWDKDVQLMLDACHNYRDKALIALAWDAGPRSGELQDLSVGDITDHEYGLQATFNGKTGRRTVTLIPSVPHVRQWLSVHPGANDRNAPLWSKLSSADDITANRLRDILKDAARRAGVTRPVTPTNFRKSSASYLASQGVSQAHLEQHHGWKRGSSIAGRYIAVFGDATDREIAAAHGIDVEPDKPDPIAPLQCPRCTRETPREKDLCVWCGQALTQQGLEGVKEQEERLFRSAAEAEEFDLEDVAELRDLAESNPVLRRVFLGVD
ncbi:tyrosine-type recombinase/integrase [Haloferax sp. MBLA0076]|uniref:Tyrosine-type recombinase/integrase n=1 Tax=Haloferax litoreum TaxID=2666140 RepID=A0A6A8GI73_9EURY|nr:MULTISPECIES: tyrosine-type recombinase/integrase [Haloferax]KAB1193644.1 phage integrase family protein [Haloferax sp. CBA1148]MRX22172.1 tyrosine-type recombinase/integrase [Haloferax litoreum]